MKATYYEIKRGRNCGTVNCRNEWWHTTGRACRKTQEARRRKLNRVQEAVGAGVMMAGLLALVCAGGSEDLPTILVVGVAGLGLFWLGAWMGHAFYGQEGQAEWLRRMWERGEIE